MQVELMPQEHKISPKTLINLEQDMLQLSYQAVHLNKGYTNTISSLSYLIAHLHSCSANNSANKLLTHPHYLVKNLQVQHHLCHLH